MKEAVSHVVRTEDQIAFAVRWIEDMLRRALKGGPVIIGLGRLLRSLDQNAKLWPMLTDVSKQCTLIINGQTMKASKEDWKDVFSAAMQDEARIALGLNGRLVVLGLSTSKLTKAEFSNLIEIIYAYGAEQGVQWSEKAKSDYEQYREAA